VRRPEGGDAAQLGGLLALDRREGAEAALALEAHHPLVEAASQDHRAVERAELVGRELRLEGGVEVALAVENRQVLDLKPRLENGSGHLAGSGALILPLAEDSRVVRRCAPRRSGDDCPDETSFHGWRRARARGRRARRAPAGLGAGHARLRGAARPGVRGGPRRRQPHPRGPERPRPLRPLYHMSAFIWEGVPLFDIRDAAGGMTDMLVRSPALGRALAQTLDRRTVALMRGHGAVIVGPSLPVAVFRSVYLETNARLQA